MYILELCAALTIDIILFGAKFSCHMIIGELQKVFIPYHVPLALENAFVHPSITMVELLKRKLKISII